MTTTPLQHKGFSLVETLFAIAILMIALVGPMTLAWSSLSSANDQRNEVTATYLAQESLEYVKNIWSMNAIRQLTTATQNSNPAWLSGLEGCMNVNGCDIRPNNAGSAGAVVSCLSCSGGFQLYKLNFDDGSRKYSLYTSDNGASKGSAGTIEQTNFKRKTVITSSGDEAFVTVTITWNNRTVPRTLTLSSVLYNY